MSFIVYLTWYNFVISFLTWSLSQDLINLFMLEIYFANFTIFFHVNLSLAHSTSDTGFLNSIIVCVKFQLPPDILWVNYDKFIAKVLNYHPNLFHSIWLQNMVFMIIWKRQKNKQETSLFFTVKLSCEISLLAKKKESF